MAFKKFVGGGQSFSPKLSIRSTGQIGLNSGAIHRFNLEKYSFVELYFDEETSLIGVKPLKEKTDGSYPLKIRNKNISISAKAFLEFFSIYYQKSRALPAKWEDSENMIVANIAPR